MSMTELEICRDYRMAKDKREQIKILADMNCCKPADIIEILGRNGMRHEKKSRPPKKSSK